MATKKDSKLMKDVVAMLGEQLGDKLIEKLAEHGHSPRDIAIAMIGGPAEAAALFGVGRQGFYKRKGNWPIEWYLALERVTGIPPRYLTLSAKEYRKLVEDERKKMEVERKKLEKPAPNGR